MWRPDGGARKPGLVPGRPGAKTYAGNIGTPGRMDGGIIHDGTHYRVVHRRVGSDRLTVVHFESWLPHPRRDAPPSAEEFFARRGINFVGIKPARNDWYQQEEIHDAIAAVRAATPGMRRVGYGGSMGGYAVLNFADALELTSLLAVCPQISIDPAKVPFEHRWDREAAAITFRHDRITAAPPIAHGFLMFDPLTDDRRHAEAILDRHPALTPLPTWFTGHEQLRMMTQTGIAADVILGLLHGRLDRAGAIRALRRVRRESPIIWLGVAKQMLRRGALGPALAAMERARAGPLPDPFDAAVTHGEILRRLGRLVEGAAQVAALLDDPVFAAAARWQLDHWQATAPPLHPSRPPPLPAPWWRHGRERAA